MILSEAKLTSLD